MSARPEVVLLSRLLDGEEVRTSLGWLRMRRGRLERALVDLDHGTPRAETVATAWVETHCTMTDFVAAARRGT